MIDLFFDNIGFLQAISFLLAFAACAFYNGIDELPDMLFCVSSGSASILFISGIALIICGCNSDYISKLEAILPHVAMSGAIIIVIAVLLLRAAFNYKKGQISPIE